MHAAGHTIGGKQRAQRKACRERLCDRDDVWLNSVMLVGEILPCATQPALNFVDNQQRSGAVAQLPRSLQKFRAQRTNSAFALNSLQANGADAAVKLPLEIVHIVEGDKPDSWHQRRKGVAVFLLPRGRQRPKRAAVERILQRQQTPFGFVPVAVLGASKSASQLERAFPGLGAAVTEERFVQAGDPGQPFRQFRLELVEKQIRDVNQAAGLPLQRRLNHGMSVTQRVHPNPAQEVEIPLAPRIPQIDAAATFKQHTLAIIGGKQKLGFGTDHGGQAHATITSVPPSSRVR